MAANPGTAAKYAGEQVPLHIHGLIAGAPPEAIHEWSLDEKDCPLYAQFNLTDGKESGRVPGVPQTIWLLTCWKLSRT